MSFQEGFTATQKKRMLLSTETLLGIRKTSKFNLVYHYYCALVKSYVEFVKYIFTLPEVAENKLAFLSVNICQDPLENFFGCQRQCGRTNHNPTAKEYYNNT